MKTQDEKQKLTEGQSKAYKPRFKIEKLEERIAPAKGGIPGSPDPSNGGGGPHEFDRCSPRDIRLCG